MARQVVGYQPAVAQNIKLGQLLWALIWYWDHLKNFIAEIPHGHLGMSIGTIWVTQKRFQGPPACHTISESYQQHGRRGLLQVKIRA